MITQLIKPEKVPESGAQPVTLMKKLLVSAKALPTPTASQLHIFYFSVSAMYILLMESVFLECFNLPQCDSSHLNLNHFWRKLE